MKMRKKFDKMEDEFDDMGKLAKKALFISSIFSLLGKIILSFLGALLLMLPVNFLLKLVGITFVLTYWQSFGICILLSLLSFFKKICWSKTTEKTVNNMEDFFK